MSNFSYFFISFLTHKVESPIERQRMLAPNEEMAHEYNRQVRMPNISYNVIII